MELHELQLKAEGLATAVVLGHQFVNVQISFGILAAGLCRFIGIPPDERLSQIQKAVQQLLDSDEAREFVLGGYSFQLITDSPCILVRKLEGVH